MKWTQIPEKLAGLSAADLRTLAAALKADISTNIDLAETKEDLEDVQKHRTIRAKVLAAAEDAEGNEAETAAEEAAAAKAEADALAAAEAAEEAPAEQTEVVEEVPVDASTPVVTSLSVETTPEVVKSTRPVGVATKWSASDIVVGKKEGESFGSFGEIAAALQDSATRMTAGSDKKVIARAFANFTPMQVLDDNKFFNLERFESTEDMTAAMCAPLEPLYDMHCMNTARRPVKNALPTFRSPTRGGFTVYPSPSLTDITTGYGQWTATDDADNDAVKEACQTIECANSEEYRIYGVYRCLTVKNLLQMTFPELVEAYLNRLAAAQARLAETLMLEAMGNGTVSIDAQTLGFNASTTILSTVLNYLALYNEVERWDVGSMEAFMPRWVLKAIQMDQVRRRRTDGGMNMVPSESTIQGWFRDVGVNAHFYMDRPSWATPIPQLATAGVLNQLPRNLEILIAPTGKFAAMDRGDLSIGVAPGNLYRDNVSNSRNEFTLFFENFEGVIDTTSCPAHILQINDLCYNGQQIADVQIDCEGQDYAGVGSGA